MKIILTEEVNDSSYSHVFDLISEVTQWLPSKVSQNEIDELKWIVSRFDSPFSSIHFNYELSVATRSTLYFHSGMRK